MNSAAQLPGADETIAALATVPGRSAIAVIRLSGPDAFRVAERLLTPWRTTPRLAYLATLCHPETGAVIDRPVVTVYAAPRSYTGEDLVELSIHGGYTVPPLALSAILTAGAREALAGEFTRRAVINGKMDLLQAEAIGDLVDARSRAMHGAAMAQLDGALSRRIAALREAIITMEALVAYDIDFPEEDTGPVPAERVATATSDLLRALDALLATAATGEAIREGAVTVIAGAPNAGKSSLFNALLGTTRAIVSAIPGTTRDALEAVIEVGRWPVRLVDTAGLRETSGVVERLGIEVSERYLGQADLVLACGDTRPSLSATVEKIRSLSSAPVIGVRTKDDLPTPSPWSVGGQRPADSSLPAGVVAVSAITGDGLGRLTARIEEMLDTRHGRYEPSAPLLTRERHRRAVQHARDEVALFQQVRDDGSVPVSIAAVHLRTAAVVLEELIGTVELDDVLDRVFSTFCVGK
ncbi:MAG TPA: tRNA uridine-5-carboxymethylaminomethyl(34) synthesis GTPase MnmE [Gemmatimonadaceae bacterium]|nr:tRNA uridine-5-carboxymethylaminomethyl(34) synthesis GTPase MnmE [Gemmatimonadaceae bacterium]